MQFTLSLFCVAIATSLLACGPTEPSVEPTPPSASASEPPPSKAEPASPEVVEPASPEAVEPAPPEAVEPAADAPESCQVQLLLEADGANGRLTRKVTLRASAKNLTDAPLELALPDRCPGGEAHFEGLAPPDGHYDFYRTCNKGMCAPDRPPRVIALPPGEVVEISSVEIDPKGEGPCNEPIAKGKYNLSFTLQPLAGGPTLCGPEPLELTR